VEVEFLVVSGELMFFKNIFLIKLTKNNYFSGLMGVRRHHHHHQELPSTITEGAAELHSAGASYHRLPTQEHESSSLSEIMPDVAIATGQLNQLQLDPPESLHLDLGDGSSHIIGAGSLQHLQV
jgi:hypothetical protein